MNTLVELAVEISKFLDEKSWKFCIIGGFAVQHWGEPRLTRDIDLTLLTGFGGEESYVDLLLAQYPSRIPEARSFALENRVLLLQSNNGIGIDISLGGLPFEEKMIERSLVVEMLPQKFVKICSAEDLVILKAFASRPTDWRDIESTIVRQGEVALDWSYIYEHLVPLCELKEEPEIIEKLKKLRLDSSS